MQKFNIDEFMEYMREEFPEPMKYHFTYNLLGNVIKDLMKQCSDKKYFANTMSTIIPEITEEEILRFC